MFNSVDNTNQSYQAMLGRAQGLLGQSAAAQAYLQPELIAFGETDLLSWLDQEPRLAKYQQFLHNLFRLQPMSVPVKSKP
jgi:oligoendopeptidase F